MSESQNLPPKEDIELIFLPNESDQLDELKEFDNSEISDIFKNSFYDLIRYSQTVREKVIQESMINSIMNQLEVFQRACNIKIENIKVFFRLLKNEKISISSEQYCDLYRLSEYFQIYPLKRLLNRYFQLHIKNVDLIINILIDQISIKNAYLDPNFKFSKEMEECLTSKIEECIRNPNFGKLPVSTIYRIIEKSDRHQISSDFLYDFIKENINERFTLFRFLNFRNLTDEKFNSLYELFKSHKDNKINNFSDYLHFDLDYIKYLKDENKRYEKQLNEKTTKLEELHTQNHDLQNQIKELEQTKEKMNQKQKELEQCKIELNQLKREKEQRDQAIIIAGRNDNYQLGPNNSNKQIIFPPAQFSIKPSFLLSYSVYYHHLVIVTSSRSLKVIGYNNDGRITSSLPKTLFSQLTELSFKDRSGCQLTPISAVCSFCGTLYMFSKNNDNERQLVFCNLYKNRGDPIFLDIGNHQPVALFGGDYNAAAICTEGEVILIKYNLVSNSRIEAVSLPNGEKASSVACGNDFFIVLSSEGHLFESKISDNQILEFSAVNELSDKEIVCLSGTQCYFLAVSKEGQVFGRGSNSEGQLGFGRERSSIPAFTEISSLKGYKIKEASAGWNHSLFETYDGKIISCGSNKFGQLLLSSGPDNDIHPPTETTITEGATFCIASEFISIVFKGCDPPSNTPNMRIQKF